MSNLKLRSPAARVGDLVFFGRMVDKIRAQAQGELPADYHANLGKGFDEACVTFLGVVYADVVAIVNRGMDDADALGWCREHGTPRTPNECFIWNEFLRKRGWNDDLTPTLERRKRERGFTERADLQTMFQFIDADEGRPTSA